MEAFLSGNPLNRRQVAEGLMALNDKVFKVDQPQKINDLWAEHLIIRHILEIATKEQKKFGDEELLDHPRTDEDLKNFLEWSDEQGISHDAVDVIRCTEVDGFCLKVNKPIKEGDTLVKVPIHAMLTSEAALQSEMLATVFEEENMGRWEVCNVVLPVFLLCQKFTDRSFWEPYIKVLPSKFDLPIFYSVEQLERLKPSPVFEATLCLYRSLALHFCAIFENVYEVHKYNKKRKNKANLTPPKLSKTPLTVYNFNFDTWLWAAGCISTRITQAPDTGDFAFIPLMDFMNLDIMPEIIEETSVENGEKKHYARLTAHRDFEVGEMNPIFDNYWTNLGHLFRTGSVPDKNPYAVYHLKLPIPRSDKYHEQKTLYYESLGYTRPDERMFNIGLEGSLVPQDLHALAKIIVSKYPHVEDYETPENEVMAIQYLKNRYMLLRRAYNIRTGTNDFEKMIERLHRSEVDILQNAEKHCANWERELEEIWEQEMWAEAESRAAAAEIADDNAPAADAVEADAPAVEVVDTDASDAGVAATESVDASSK